VSPAALEKFLKDLPRNGTLIKDRGYRQVWYFRFEDKGYFLKFYPRKGLAQERFSRDRRDSVGLGCDGGEDERRGVLEDQIRRGAKTQHPSQPWISERYARVKSALKRIFRGSPAMREFIRLQALQRAGVPAPRAVAQLSGFRLREELGDAVILEAIEPAISLDQFVTDYGSRGEPIPDHLGLTKKIIDLVRKLGEAKLGHDDLHLGNMLLKRGAGGTEEIYLLDGYAVRFGGLKMNDVMKLAHSVRGVATRADLQRGWEELGPGGPMPKVNPVSNRQWRKFIERSRSENDYFGLLRDRRWRGMLFKQYKYPRRWAPASGLKITKQDWERAWPELWKNIEQDKLQVLKRGQSGDVLAGELELGGRKVAIIAKRPFKRYWYRYLNEIGRGSRAWRAWHKAWTLVVRDFPTAWPLLVMQKRKLGYITDSVIVFERVPGEMLAHVDLDRLKPAEREMLLRRTGRILRQIDDLGLSHFDAKASNWIVLEDDKLGPRPVLVDVDGIRFRRWQALGIERLLRAMRDHPQYTPADSLQLCQGYAPHSPTLVKQETPDEPPGAEQSTGEKPLGGEKSPDHRPMGQET
jgi:tRNA A-37 threonylcarbamoyl transferase component Bud32